MKRCAYLAAVVCVLAAASVASAAALINDDFQTGMGAWSSTSWTRVDVRGGRGQGDASYPDPETDCAVAGQQRDLGDALAIGIARTGDLLGTYKACPQDSALGPIVGRSSGQDWCHEHQAQEDGQGDGAQARQTAKQTHGSSHFLGARERACATGHG